MELHIDNHEWLQDEEKTKSALCFSLEDLPPEWPQPIEPLAFEQSGNEWRMTVQAGSDRHVLTFEAHPQLIAAQSRYPGLTLIGLNAMGEWITQAWLVALPPAS